MSNRSISYCHALFHSFFISLIAVATLYPFPIAAVAEREQENDDDDNTDEDFEEQNTIQICCTWGHNKQDGVLTYYIDAESSTKQQQVKVRDAIQEWNRNIDNLKLEKTLSKQQMEIY